MLAPVRNEVQLPAPYTDIHTEVPPLLHHDPRHWALAFPCKVGTDLLLSSNLYAVSALGFKSIFDLKSRDYIGISETGHLSSTAEETLFIS
jgi:hypothetical protein